MNLVSLRVITDDPASLVRFYTQVTGVQPTWSTEDFAELTTSAGTLAIAHTRTIDRAGAGVARPADNHSVIIEFLVDDVDQTYDRLKPLLHHVVLPPTTQPWGNRSLLFRDPDGNLVNFFTPVSAEARKKFKVS